MFTFKVGFSLQILFKAENIIQKPANVTGFILIQNVQPLSLTEAVGKGGIIK